jgi:hypothetical protein
MCPVDLTDSEVLVPVLDDRVEVSALPFERPDDVGGIVRLTIDSEAYAAVNRYSTWRLFVPALFNYPLLQGRLVKP